MIGSTDFDVFAIDLISYVHPIHLPVDISMLYIVLISLCDYKRSTGIHSLRRLVLICIHFTCLEGFVRQTMNRLK